MSPTRRTTPLVTAAATAGRRSGRTAAPSTPLHTTTAVQRGLHSRFAPRGRYAWQEETHRQFNRWLVNRYRKHWPSST